MSSEVQKASVGMSSKDKEQSIKLRPTLYIGVGGTGMEVMMRVRRRILNASWGSDKVRLESLAQFPLAQFIHFDLDQGAIIDSGRAQTEDLQYNLVKFTDDERLVESFDIEKYSRDDASLNRYPHIQNWLPLTPKKIRELGIDPAKGAGQIRSLSRLYFFDKYPKIKDKIRSKLSVLKAGLSNADMLKKINSELDKKFRIVVIGSVAGGTGSGSFLDMGWLAEWIAKSTVGEADVEFMMFLPTGYASANKDRTEANGYAALMELETCMVGHSQYIEKWDNYDNPTLSLRPYKEVYLIDSGNLGQQHTNNINDVYSMVAETLFEDFRSADFANKKRSVAVNQNQHKLDLFSPPVDAGRFGDMKLNYSCAYSAFGQATLDTLGHARATEYVYRLASDMLKAFFGVASSDPNANRASEKQRDTFMKDFMSLSAVPFNDLPEFSPATLKNSEIAELKTEFMDLNIVEVLLRSGQSGVEVDVTEDTRQRVNQRIDEIKNVDREQWGVEVRKTMQGLLRDVIRNTDSMSDTAEDRVMRRRKALFENLKQELEAKLYQYLDNQEHGGLEYVISLVEQIKDKIENTNSGICVQLKASSERYTKIKDALQSYEYEKQLKDLDETKGRSLWGGSKEEQARTILENLKTDIASILAFHLRAKAALEAIELMKDISKWLGNSQGVDESGRTLWDGVLGDLQDGQNAVLDMMTRLDRDQEIIHQNIRSKHATVQIIETEEVAQKNIAPHLLQEWAVEAFKDFGGSREIFRQLVDPDGHPKLLLTILRMAERQLEKTEQDAEVHEDALYVALDKMSAIERQKIFSDWLQRAMPWIDATLNSDLRNIRDRFKIFIGVKSAEQFSKKFKAELRGCIPTGFDLNIDNAIIETGEAGRAVCYVELSGIPFTMLRGIETWRTSYYKEVRKDNPIPIHAHIDTNRFKHPYAPTPRELNTLADDFKCYLKAVILGVLKRCDIPDLVPTGQYEFTVARGDVRRLGNERSFRLNGLPQSYRDNIHAQVKQKLEQIKSSKSSLVLLIALVDFYAKQVYTPRLVQDESATQIDHIGFACAITKELQKELLQDAAALKIPDADIERAYKLTEKPEDMQAWASLVKNSDEDAYLDEIREKSNDHPRLKWVMNMSPSVLQQHEAILQGTTAGNPMMASAVPAPPPAFGAAPPPLQPQLPKYQYHVAIHGQTYGPYPHEQMLSMLHAKQIDHSAQVWREGLAGWIAISQCPELMVVPPPLTQSAPPPVPVPPPLS